MYFRLCGKIYDTHYFHFLLTLCMDNIRACATDDGNLSKKHYQRSEIWLLVWNGRAAWSLSWCFLAHSWVAFKEVAISLWNWVILSRKHFASFCHYWWFIEFDELIARAITEGTRGCKPKNTPNGEKLVEEWVAWL